jgi:single-strand DNA-binding protein
MTYELTGKIKAIMPAQTFGSGFRRREFVVVVPDEKDSKWDQPIKLEFVKDKCDLLDAFSVGETVAVSFALRGSENNDRFFVNLNAFKITRVPRQAATRPEEDYARNAPKRETYQRTDDSGDGFVDF